MATTSARMLRLLSLLQTHRYWPGAELAGRLEVSPRTLRRDIDRLRELGYDVDAVRGVAGGYQLRAGRSLPPLLLEDDEAVAIAVGLRTAAAGAVAGMEEFSLQALTKLIGLMPPGLRRRMDAVQSQTVAGPRRGPTIDAATLTTLAQGCRDDEAVRFEYAARGREAAQRHVEPHRLVSMGQKWYVVAYDRDRADWRTFRVDRIHDVRLTGSRYRARTLPAEDALAYVQASFAAMPRRYDVRVRVAADAEEIERQLGWGWTVTPDGAGCVATMATDWLDWPLASLAGVDADARIESPPELVAAAVVASRRLAGAAGTPAEPAG